MPKDMTADIRVEAVAGKPIELPNGNFVANAEMTRSGMDLHLTAPDGHSIIIEGYFAQTPAPDLVTHDGARLTPAMVNAFVPPEHAGQYAASGQITNDASPAGKITQVVGDATIVRADGTHVAAAAGMPIYQGDVIETSKTGAVNIQFADNTTFAISESARMSVDQFVYHPDSHSGSTFFSMLQGVFVYTSGLIGKTDPGSVNIETPVGSIGIRGTVVAGHIMPAGQPSQITILDGAITVTNGAGTQEMNTSLATISLNGYQAQAQSVTMDAQTFNQSYHSVSSVAGETINHFTGASSPAPANQPEHTPTGAAPPAAGSETAPAPAGATAPAPHAAAPTAPAPAAPAPADGTAPTAPTGSVAPAPSTTTDATTQAATTAPAPVTAPPPVVTVDTTIAPPASTSSFSSGSSATTFSSGSSTTSFSAPPTTGGTSGGSTAAPPPPAPPATTTTAAPPVTTAPPPPPPLAVGLLNDTGLSHTDSYTSDATLKVTGQVSGATIQYNVDNTGWTSVVTGLANGTHTVTVQELDATSTVIATSAPLTFTLDTAAPAAPTVALASDTSGGSGITSIGGLNVSGIETNAKVQFSTDGGATWSVPMAANALPTTWSQGAHTVMIQQVDQAGNISAPTSINFTYDTTAPIAPTVSLINDTGVSSTDNITKLSALNAAGVETNAMVEYRTFNGTTWSGWGTPMTASAFSAVSWADGNHTVQVQQIDQAGNASTPSTSFTFTVDTTAAAPGITLATDTGISNTDGVTKTVSFNYSGVETGATILYSTDGVTFTSGLPTWVQGSNTVYVEQTDLAGNTSTASGPLTFTYVTGFSMNPVAFSSAYNVIDAVKSNAGVADFAAIGTVVGTAAPSGLPSGDSIVSYSVTVDTTGGNNPMEIVPATGSAGVSGAYTTQALANPNTAFLINSSGVITVNNPMVLLSSLNPYLVLDITATDAAGNTSTYQQTVVVANDGTFSNIGVSSSATSGVLSGTSGADFLYSAGSSGPALYGYGGADVLIGGTGNDSIVVADANFREVDGGGGSNSLQLDVGGTANPTFTMDFTTSTAIVRNISNLDLGFSGTQGNSAIINLQNVYDMTPAANHTLNIAEGGGLIGSHLNVVGGGLTGFLLQAGSIWGVTPDLIYTGTVSGSTVTLDVKEFVNPNDSITSPGGILVMDGNHTQAPTMESNGSVPYAGTTGADFIIDTNTSGLGGGPNPFNVIGQYSTVQGNGGNDVIIGSTGDNLISVADASFQLVDGGAGYDRLQFAPTTGTINMDFTTLPQTVRNIEEIDLNSNGANAGNSIQLDIKNIFDMTATGTLHILESNSSATGAGVTIHVADGNGTLTYDSVNSTSTATGTAAGDVHYTGTYNGHAVTLVITEANSTGAGHVAIATV